ncbi:MAG TPA: glycosyltransferase [Burkholderiales bacterium]|nr:glycosyltransferase [Burkholderiales bacterium]
MRVTLYLKHFPPSGGPLNDGTSIAVDGLASGLAANGARVTVLCEGVARSSVKTTRRYAVECFPNERRYRTFALAPGLKRYVADYLAHRPGLCLLNGMFHPSVYSMGRWLLRHGVPYVVVPHDPYDRAVFGTNAHLKWPYWYLFERRLLKRARAVQLLDAKHEACLRRLGIGTRVIETMNGVALDAVPPESQLRWRVPEAPVHLVFLGRIDAYNKGLDILLSALPHLTAVADARLTLQGPDWGDRARLERQAAEGTVAGGVTFLNADYGRPAPRIIAEHDVFCLPSRFEGFGLAALEAMLAARVLLVSERAGIARHVAASGCGVVVEPTPAAVGQGLLALLQRRAEWRAMGLAGRRYALDNLQWKSIAATALEDYRRLAA